MTKNIYNLQRQGKECKQKFGASAVYGKRIEQIEQATTHSNLSRAKGGDHFTYYEHLPLISLMHYVEGEQSVSKPDAQSTQEDPDMNNNAVIRKANMKRDGMEN